MPSSAKYWSSTFFNEKSAVWNVIIKSKGIVVNSVASASLPIKFVLKLEVLFISWTCCRRNLSNREHCYDLNKVTKHKLSGSKPYACINVQKKNLGAVNSRDVCVNWPLRRGSRSVSSRVVSRRRRVRGPRRSSRCAHTCPWAAESRGSRAVGCGAPESCCSCGDWQTDMVVSNRDITIGNVDVTITYRAQWLTGRSSDSQLWEPGFESCAAVLKPWASFSLYIAPVHSAV